MGASSGSTNGRKIAHMKRVATQRGLPMVFLGESSGARMPDHMGARGMGTLLGNDGTQYQRMRETPWASATLGLSYGSSSWYAVLSDFNVMRKGAMLAVSSSLLASLAIKEEVDPQEMGGWRVHAEVTGFADQVVDTRRRGDRRDQGFPCLPAVRTIAKRRRWRRCPPARARGCATSSSLLPESRTQVYDMRKLIRTDRRQGQLLRAEGALRQGGRHRPRAAGRPHGGHHRQQPALKGGAMDADACDKITSFIVLCDSFNIPLVMFVDTPGFVIGTEAERRRAPGKIMNLMNALALTTVPKLSVILRKSYGQAYLNMGGGRNSDEVRRLADRRSQLHGPEVRGDGRARPRAGRARLRRGAAPRWTATARSGTSRRSTRCRSVIRPQETRDYLIRMLDVHRLRLTNGVGQHLMRAWPTSF